MEKTPNRTFHDSYCHRRPAVVVLDIKVLVGWDDGDGVLVDNERCVPDEAWSHEGCHSDGDGLSWTATASVTHP